MKRNCQARGFLTCLIAARNRAAAPLRRPYRLGGHFAKYMRPARGKRDVTATEKRDAERMAERRSPHALAIVASQMGQGGVPLYGDS